MTVRLSGTTGSHDFNNGDTFAFGPAHRIIPAGTDCFVVAVLAIQVGGGSETPASVTYNNLNLTLVPGSAGTNVSVWYLLNPPTGGNGFNLTVTWATTKVRYGVMLEVPLIGVDPTTPFGNTPTINSGTSTSPSVIGSQGAGGDLYLGFGFSSATTDIADVSPQVTINGCASGAIRSTASARGASYPGGTIGPFNWTIGTSNPWNAVTVAVLHAPLTGQTSSTSFGQIGAGDSYATTAQTVSSTEGTPTYSVGPTITGQTVTTTEGSIVAGTALQGQTIVSSEGILTTSFQNNVTLALNEQSAQFAVGSPGGQVGYILDNSQVILAGQTLSSMQGVMAPAVVFTANAQSLNAVEGVPTDNLAYSLLAETIVSTEGIVTAQAGSSFNNNLTAQTINSSEGIIGYSLSYPVTAETITSVLGNVTFSNVPFFIQIGSQNSIFTEGVVVIGPSTGTGPPLFIPPQLGKPVTTRTFSWLEMASRAWGSEFRAPDHRIYQFSGGNYKDSTDMGTTGIYSPNLGTPDNPPHP